MEKIPGGADTTASAIGTFFLAMVCYPEAQKKAQTELDNVLNGRLPEHSDIPSLPYLSALVKEVFRYASICSLL
jgi:cytochrome P450